MGKWYDSFSFPSFSALFGGDKEPLVKKGDEVSSIAQKALDESSETPPTPSLKGRASSIENRESAPKEPSGGSPGFGWAFLRVI
jgi:hypothetical protein